MNPLALRVERDVSFGVSKSSIRSILSRKHTQMGGVNQFLEQSRVFAREARSKTKDPAFGKLCSSIEELAVAIEMIEAQIYTRFDDSYELLTRTYFAAEKAAEKPTK